MATAPFNFLAGRTGQAVWKALPVINFGIASLALTFQTTVLYPWHMQLEDDFNELKHVHEDQLSRYHQLKLDRLDSIDRKLESLSSTVQHSHSKPIQ